MKDNFGYYYAVNDNDNIRGCLLYVYIIKLIGLK